jgi:hypothetical protein
MLSGVMRGERPPRVRIYLTPPETLGIFEEGGTLFREGVYAAPALRLVTLPQSGQQKDLNIMFSGSGCWL